MSIASSNSHGFQKTVMFNAYAIRHVPMCRDWTPSWGRGGIRWGSYETFLGRQDGGDGSYQFPQAATMAQSCWRALEHWGDDIDGYRAEFEVRPDEEGARDIPDWVGDGTLRAYWDQHHMTATGIGPHPPQEDP